jgi:ferritin-like metal-binding protein YciE
MAFSDEAFDVFVTGMKNAHAMENQALSILRPQAKRIENYPEMRARIETHISETEGQIARLDTIFDDIQKQHSGFKDMVLSVGGSMAALSHAAAGDEILKDAFANHAFENYEIAAYRSLLGLADILGMESIKPLLEQTLEEEKQMAQWIADNIEAVTSRYVELRQADTTAKR